MRYPTIDQYVDILRDAQRFCKTLGGITLLTDTMGQPIYSSGNFGVVFSALSNIGEPIAIKCFTRHQWGRKRAYDRLLDGMPKSPYFVQLEYLQNEIEYAPYGSDFMLNFDVLLMERVEGRTLSEELCDAVLKRDLKRLELLSRNFDTMAVWLLSQPIAHGDVKPDNIMVDRSGDMRLIDYDGFFTEQMEGECQREFGTEGFQHPLRHCAPFDRHIDDYSLAALSLTLRVAVRDTDTYERFTGIGSAELVFDPSEAVISSSIAINYIRECSLAEEFLLDAACSSSTVIAGLAQNIEGSYIGGIRANIVELRAVKVDNKWGFADLDGKMVVSARWDLVRKYVGGYAAISNNGKWGYVSSKGKVIVSPRYERVWDFSADDGLAMVRNGGQYGYVDRRGVERIAVQYEYAMPFSEGYAVVSIEGKFGYIDCKGNIVKQACFDSARSVRNGEGEVVCCGKKLRFMLRKVPL